MKEKRSLIPRGCMVPSLEMSSSFSNVKHATSTAGNAINEMGGSAREVVLDIVSGFGCRNDSGGIFARNVESVFIA